MANLPEAVPILPVYTDADLAVTSTAGDVNPATQWFDDMAVNLNQLMAASSAVHGFGTDPGLAYYAVTQPTGIEQYDVSIPAGKLRYTAPSGNTNNNLRVVLPAGKAGVCGDAEVRSTWSAQSTAMADTHGRFQPGHSHRVTAHKQVITEGVATGGGVSTLTDSSKSFVVNQFSSAAQSMKREFYVSIMDGTSGVMQTRRITANTATQLTVNTGWLTSNPTAGNNYTIWCWNVRAVTLTQNVVFAAHGILNINVWEGSSYTNVAGFDLSAYLKPGGTYAQFPWKVRSKVVGRTLSVAVAKGSDEPVYGAAGRSGSFTIPAGFEQPGMHGLYLGHMDAGDWLEFDDLTVIRL